MDTISKIRAIILIFKKMQGGSPPSTLPPILRTCASDIGKRRLAWHSIEARDALVAVPKSDGNKDMTHFPEGVFSKVLKNKRDLPKVEIRHQVMRN